MKSDLLMIVGIISFVIAYVYYEARNDVFYRDLENKKLNVEINKIETLKGIVDMCKSLEIHLKIVRENQKIIINKMSEKSPIVLNNEPRVDFCDKAKMKEQAEKKKRKQELFDMQEKAQKELDRIRQIINSEIE